MARMLAESPCRMSDLDMMGHRGFGGSDLGLGEIFNFRWIGFWM